MKPFLGNVKGKLTLKLQDIQGNIGVWSIHVANLKEKSVVNLLSRPQILGGLFVLS